MGLCEGRTEETREDDAWVRDGMVYSIMLPIAILADDVPANQILQPYFAAKSKMVTGFPPTRDLLEVDLLYPAGCFYIHCVSERNVEQFLSLTCSCMNCRKRCY